MPRGAEAQPECIHYIFIFLWQRRIVRGSCVRSGFRCGGLKTLMSSNNLEGNTSALAETYACCCWERTTRVLNHPRHFSTGCAKRKLQLWIVSCYSSRDPYHFAEILEL